MKNLIKTTLLFICLIGCTFAGLAQTSDKAMVYFIHKYKYTGCVHACEITINGEYVGSTKVKKYLKMEYAPGGVEIETNGNNLFLPQSINEYFEAGREYFFLIELEQENLIKMAYHIRPISSETANEYINKYKEIL